MPDKVNNRIQSYEKRLSYLEGQTQGQSPKLIDKNVFDEIEQLKGDLDEMKKVVAEFESSFEEQFPSIEKPAKSEKNKSSQSDPTGCVKAILIAFIIIVLVFIFIMVQNQQ